MKHRKIVLSVLAIACAAVMMGTSWGAYQRNAKRDPDVGGSQVKVPDGGGAGVSPPPSQGGGGAASASAGVVPAQATPGSAAGSGMGFYLDFLQQCFTITTPQ